MLHPWDSPGKNTGVGCHSLLQGIFPTQGSNPGVAHGRQTLPSELRGLGSDHSPVPGVCGQPSSALPRSGSSVKTRAALSLSRAAGGAQERRASPRRQLSVSDMAPGQGNDGPGECCLDTLISMSEGVGDAEECGGPRWKDAPLPGGEARRVVERRPPSGGLG